MTTSQILLGTGLVVALAVGCQVVASLLRVPAILLLLPAGFVAGTLTDDVDPQKLLGPAFSPLVSLAVAVILYDSGLGLDLRHLKGHTRTVVVRLVWLGALVTAVAAALIAVPLLGMSLGAAVMLGAILVVRGAPRGGGAGGVGGPPPRPRRGGGVKKVAGQRRGCGV
ncbi:cation:proton antiporter, partial [Streptomyces lavendulae]|uniref:cation:proton antiporter domain-containing protein n=1 Tax=Streptomyces lavendulae TaxID=1914 RepID=UPI0036A74F97